MVRTDVQLMLDVKAGDGNSFELLLQGYRTPIVNFLFRKVRNREQAEDPAQEGFLRVYRARQEYVPSAKFTTWLFRIATNLALNSVRDNRYQKLEVSIDAPVSMDAEDGDERTMDVPEKHPNIEQHLVEEARRKMIRRAIDKLPEKQRAAVLLHKYEELDYAEIAKILNCSESALKSLLFRAYEALRMPGRAAISARSPNSSKSWRSPRNPALHTCAAAPRLVAFPAACRSRDESFSAALLRRDAVRCSGASPEHPWSFHRHLPRPSTPARRSKLPASGSGCP